MLMFTFEGYEAQIELTRAIERWRIAEMLRERAEANPKWEVHDLLKSIAQEIEDAGKRN